jgi:hypothetical protein
MTARAKGRRSLRCAGDLTIRTASATHEALCSEFQSRDEITLDLAQTGDVDLTFVQLVESARLTAIRQSKKLSLVATASGALLDVLERGGFVGPGTSGSAFWLRGEN